MLCFYKLYSCLVYTVTAAVTAELGHLTGPQHLSQYTCTRGESSYLLKSVGGCGLRENLPDILLPLTSPVGDLGACKFSGIHCADAELTAQTPNSLLRRRIHCADAEFTAQTPNSLRRRRIHCTDAEFTAQTLSLSYFNGDSVRGSCGYKIRILSKQSDVQSQFLIKETIDYFY